MPLSSYVFKYLTLFLFVETEQSGFLTSFVTSAKAGWRPDSPESYLVLSLQIILPVILLSPPVMIQACFVGVCSDGPELLQQNLIIVASKSVWQSQWEESADTCPVLPPTTRPSFIFGALIPLRGFLWQQSNEGEPKRSTGGEDVTSCRKCQSRRSVSVIHQRKMICATLREHRAICTRHGWVLLCSSITSNFLQKYFLRATASPRLHRLPERQMKGTLIIHGLIFSWQWEQDVPLPVFQGLIPSGSKTSSRPIFSFTRNHKGFGLF